MNNDSPNTRSSIQLASHYYSIGRPQDALEALNNGPPQSVDIPTYWLMRGAILLALKKDQQSLEAIEKGLTQFPDFTPLLALGAAVHQDEGRLAQAERMILSALQAESENVDYLIQYSSLLTMGGSTRKKRKRSSTALAS